METIQKNFYSFNAIFQEDITRKALIEYGKELFIEENMEFMLQFEDYLLTSTTNKPTRAKKIIDLYINEESSSTLNISSDIRKSVTENYKLAEEGKKFWDGSIFIEAYQAVYL